MKIGAEYLLMWKAKITHPYKDIYGKTVEYFNASHCYTNMNAVNKHLDSITKRGGNFFSRILYQIYKMNEDGEYEIMDKEDLCYDEEDASCFEESLITDLDYILS